MRIEPVAVAAFLAVLDDIFRHRLAAHAQLAVAVDLIFNAHHRQSHGTGIEQAALAAQLQRGDADFAHAVAVRETVADGVEKFEHLRTDTAAARYHKDNAFAEHALAHFLERELGKRVRQRGIAELTADAHALFKLFDGLLAAVADGAHRLLIDLFPEQRHREDMRHLVALDGVRDRLRLHIVEPHEGAREKREPHIDRHQTENMIKR